MTRTRRVPRGSLGDIWADPDESTSRRKGWLWQTLSSLGIRRFDVDSTGSLPTLAGTIVFDADPPFRPLRRRDGYLVLEDMGLIGDGTTSALVGLDGGIPWLCLPRFDSKPLF